MLVTNSITQIPDRSATGTITGFGTLAINCQGCGSVNIQITNSGTAWSGNIVFQGTIDNINWIGVNALSSSPTVANMLSTTITTNGIYIIPCGGYQQIRVIGFTVTNNAAISMQASSASSPLVNIAADGYASSVLPSYTDGKLNYLSLTTSGLLRIDGSNVTQPVSGTGNFTVIQSTAASLRSQTASEASTGATVPTVAGLAGGSVTTAAPTYVTGNIGALSLTTGGLLRVTSPLISSLNYGNTALTTANTNYIVNTTIATTSGVLLCAPLANTAAIYVGTLGVTTGTGIELQPGDREFFPVNDVSILYVVSGSNSQNVRWMVL